jgi:hypothetical protein
MNRWLQFFLVQLGIDTSYLNRHVVFEHRYSVPVREQAEEARTFAARASVMATAIIYLRQGCSGSGILESAYLFCCSTSSTP